MESTLWQNTGVSWKLTINLDFHYMSNSMRWVGMDGFWNGWKRGDGSNATREVCKTSLMLMQALAKLTNCAGCCITAAVCSRRDGISRQLVVFIWTQADSRVDHFGCIYSVVLIKEKLKALWTHTRSNVITCCVPQTIRISGQILNHYQQMHYISSCLCSQFSILLHFKDTWGLAISFPINQFIWALCC